MNRIWFDVAFYVNIIAYLKKQYLWQKVYRYKSKFKKLNGYHDG